MTMSDDTSQDPDTRAAHMPQRLYDKLTKQLSQEVHGGAPAMEHLGQLLRQWRLGHDLTRAELANRLNMQTDLLLCLEHGIADPADVSIEQLASILTLLSDGSLDSESMELLKYLEL